MIWQLARGRMPLAMRGQIHSPLHQVEATEMTRQEVRHLGHDCIHHGPPLFFSWQPSVCPCAGPAILSPCNRNKAAPLQFYHLVRFLINVYVYLYQSNFTLKKISYYTMLDQPLCLLACVPCGRHPAGSWKTLPLEECFNVCICFPLQSSSL